MTILSNIYPGASDRLCNFKVEQNYSVTVRATCVTLEVHMYIALVVQIYRFPLCQTYSPAFQSNTPALNARN
jgi:hypothetical protein